jgi:Inorganic pyrophosphatase
VGRNDRQVADHYLRQQIHRRDGVDRAPERGEHRGSTNAECDTASRREPRSNYRLPGFRGGGGLFGARHPQERDTVGANEGADSETSGEPKAGGDDKVLCVPATDPRWDHITDIADAPSFELEAIKHFFAHYKELEPGKYVKAGNWANSEAAEAEVQHSVDRFHPNESD